MPWIEDHLLFICFVVVLSWLVVSLAKDVISWRKEGKPTPTMPGLPIIKVERKRIKPIEVEEDSSG